MTENKKGSNKDRPSRAEIETLCVLYAIGSEGCRANELAGRLGLSANLAPFVAQGMRPLVLRGLLVLHENRIHPLDAGLELLAHSLAEWGVAELVRPHPQAADHAD